MVAFNALVSMTVMSLFTLTTARPSPTTAVTPVWPEYGHAYTNGERMARGMKLKKPEKRHGALQPRLSPAPASSKDGAYTFEFYSCYSTVSASTNGRSETLVNQATAQDAVDACVSFNNNVDYFLAIVPTGTPGSYTCFTAPNVGGQETCTATDGAGYVLQ